MQPTRPLALLLIVLVLATAAPSQPISPAAPGDLFLPLIRTAGQPGPTIAGCPLFPADNIWNARVDSLPVDPRSRQYIATMNDSATHIHADFGSGVWNGGPIGIPYMVVDSSTPRAPVSFYYEDESDREAYPFPPNPLIEGGPAADGDRHVLLVDKDACRLYELYDAWPQSDGTWRAGSGAIYDLTSNALRPAGWTSADAAGLPILPGLVRYEEVAAGRIAHAIRFTSHITRKEYLWPARHFASSNTSLNVPPMGQRFRLKADYPIASFSPEAQVILTAMKEYGLILADNGTSWMIGGVPDERWNNDDLHAFHQIPSSAFEAVDVSSLMLDPNSGQVKP